MMEVGVEILYPLTILCPGHLPLWPPMLRHCWGIIPRSGGQHLSPSPEVPHSWPTPYLKVCAEHFPSSVCPFLIHYSLIYIMLKQQYLSDFFTGAANQLSISKLIMACRYVKPFLCEVVVDTYHIITASCIKVIILRSLNYLIIKEPNFDPLISWFSIHDGNIWIHLLVSLWTSLKTETVMPSRGYSSRDIFKK